MKSRRDELKVAPPGGISWHAAAVDRRRGTTRHVHPP